MSEYKKSKHYMGRRKWVEHRYNPKDKKLFGRYGYIWECPNGRYAASIHSPKILNSKYPDPKFIYRSGHEKTVYFDHKELYVMVCLLGVPERQKDQIEHADAYDA